VLPAKRPCQVGKDSGHTSRIERFNNTLRQRVSRLVRKALSFSKKVEKHIGAMWYFIHHYHASLASCESLPFGDYRSGNYLPDRLLDRNA
jgi:hypothetical protein